MKLITKLSVATTGLALLTLASSTTASAIQLQASGNISGFVSRGSSTTNNPSGVKVGDVVQGSYSVTFDSSVFSTGNTFGVTVPLDSIEVSVGTKELVVDFPFRRTPNAFFLRQGDFFVFYSVSADLVSFNVFENQNFRIPVTLTGGLTSPPKTGVLATTRTQSIPVPTERWSASIKQTCQGSGCQFRVNTPPPTSVPEGSSTTSVLAIGILGISFSVKNFFLKRKKSLQKE
jgi:hypothetical protein